MNCLYILEIVSCFVCYCFLPFWGLFSHLISFLRCEKSFQVQPVPICSPCFYFRYSGRWIIEDLAVIYVGECPAQAFLKCNSLVAVCRLLIVVLLLLHSMGSVVVAQGLSWSAACGVFSDQGSNLSPALAGGFFTTEPPWKPQVLKFLWNLSFFMFIQHSSIRILVHILRANYCYNLSCLYLGFLTT